MFKVHDNFENCYAEITSNIIDQSNVSDESFRKYIDDLEHKAARQMLQDQASQRELLEKYKKSMMNTIMEEDDEASDGNVQGKTQGTAIRSGLRDLDEEDMEEDNSNKLK